jgi:hypothetical protein
MSQEPDRAQLEELLRERQLHLLLDVFKLPVEEVRRRHPSLFSPGTRLPPEQQAVMRKTHARYHRNRDGVLDLEEVAAMRQERREEETAG